MLPVQNIFVRGVGCAVHDSAPGGSPEAVVFVHGNPGPMDDWEFLVPSVSEFARAIAMDLPGFGRSEHPRRFDFNVAGYARYLGALLETLGVRRVHLVLHDFGGGFGLAWAATHPELCASITLINTGVLSGYRWHKFAKIWQTPIVGELFQGLATTGMVKRLIDADNPKPVPPGYVERIMSYADWAHRRAVLKLYRASRDPSLHFAQHTDELARMKVPVCVVWGDSDPYIPASFAPRQREVFPHADVHVLPGLGHWPFHDDPAGVRAIVVPFLKDQVTGRASPERVAPSPG